MFASLDVYASVQMWTDCSKPIYSFGYGAFNDLMAELPDEIVQKEFEINRKKAEKIQKEYEEVRALLDTLESKELKNEGEIKAYLETAIPHYKKTQGYRRYATGKYVNMESARFNYVYNLFVLTGEEIEAEEGIDANFVGTPLIKCDVDRELTKKVHVRTANKLITIINGENH